MGDGNKAKRKSQISGSKLQTNEQHRKFPFPVCDLQLSSVNSAFRNKESRLNKVKVAQFGLGPIGIESVRLAAEKSWIEIVGGIDIDPAKVGRSLTDLTGDSKLAGAKVYKSFDELC